jgi:hypothetical protein
MTYPLSSPSYFQRAKYAAVACNGERATKSALILLMMFAASDDNRVVDVDYRASADAADKWFKENDPGGVAFG